MDKNNSQKIGKLYQLTHNYKGYRKMKSILELGLERVEKQLVESIFTITQVKRKSWKRELKFNSKLFRFKTATN